MAVPLSPLYPPAELAWFAADAGADTAIVAPELDDCASALVAGRRILRPADLCAPAPYAGEDPHTPAAGDTALLLYTSGTTGKPKGAVITHANLAVQRRAARGALGLARRDVLLHVLPLHHLHGLGIALLTALRRGRRVRMLPPLRRARRVGGHAGGATVFMAVPTITRSSSPRFDDADAATRARWAAARAASGWSRAARGAAGHARRPAGARSAGAYPLERFGMTEIGVGTTQPARADRPAPRQRGLCRCPPSRRASSARAGRDAGSGELWISRAERLRRLHGSARRPRATRLSSTARAGSRRATRSRASPTGTCASSGRTSVDILKSGGYKLSALEIEEVLREHPAVAEVAVVGVPDETWGDRVVACIVAARRPRRRVRRRRACAPWRRSGSPPTRCRSQVVVMTDAAAQRRGQGGEAGADEGDRGRGAGVAHRGCHPRTDDVRPRTDDVRPRIDSAHPRTAGASREPIPLAREPIPLTREPIPLAREPIPLTREPRAPAANRFRSPANRFRSPANRYRSPANRGRQPRTDSARPRTAGASREPMTCAREPIPLTREPIPLTREPMTCAREPIPLTREPRAPAANRYRSLANRGRQPRTDTAHSRTAGAILTPSRPTRSATMTCPRRCSPARGSRRWPGSPDPGRRPRGRWRRRRWAWPRGG